MAAFAEERVATMTVASVYPLDKLVDGLAKGRPLQKVIRGA